MKRIILTISSIFFLAFTTEAFACHASLIIQEKSWHMFDYSIVEDRGGTWYVLWEYDKHRCVITVDAEGHDVINITIPGQTGSFKSLGNNQYEIPISGNQENVYATVTLRPKTGGNSFTIKTNAVSWTTHSIEIEWVESEKCHREPDDPEVPDEEALLLAQVTPGNPSWIALQVPVGFNPYFNQLQVEVNIDPPIPNGRWGTVHLEWYDPNDDEEIIIPPPSTAPANPGAIRDNIDVTGAKATAKGVLTFVGDKTLTFIGGAADGKDKTAKTVLKFPYDCFTANFLVAAHPRKGDEIAYSFEDGSNKKKLFYQDRTTATPNPPWKPLPDELHTKELLVLSWQGINFSDRNMWKLVGKGTQGDRKWVFDRTNYTMRTPLPTISDTESINTEQPAPKSVLDYEEKFHMTVVFDYVGAEYVNAVHAKNPHRSFHRNSGVKIYGIFEIQIYDTAALLAVGPLLEEIDNAQPASPKANWQSVQGATTGIEKVGDTAYESISGCVTNIPYQSNLWWNKTKTDLTSVTGRKKLDFNFLPAGGLFNIETSDESYGNLQYGTGGSYNTLLFNANTLNPDRKLHLQAHWGSGVLFEKITITKP